MILHDSEILTFFYSKNLFDNLKWEKCIGNINPNSYKNTSKPIKEKYS